MEYSSNWSVVGAAGAVAAAAYFALLVDVLWIHACGGQVGQDKRVLFLWLGERSSVVLYSLSYRLVAPMERFYICFFAFFGSIASEVSYRVLNLSIFRAFFVFNPVLAWLGMRRGSWEVQQNCR